MVKSRLLMKSKPLVVDKDLATLIGLNEAIVLQQIEYWVNIKEEADNKNLKTIEQNYVNGAYWTYNTIDEWAEEFPFWSYDTVKRTLKSLREKGVVYAEALSEWGADRTLWYRPNHEKLISLESELLEVKNSINLKNEKRKNNRKNYSKKSKFKTENTHEALKTLNSAKCTNGKVQNALMERCKMHQAITKISTKNSTKNSISNITSSKGEKSPQAIRFESIIGKSLGVTTLPNFEEYVEKYSSDFIDAILDYAEECNPRTYSWFRTTIESYLEKGIDTAEGVKNQINDFREDNKQKKNRALKQKEEKRKASEEAHERDMALIVASEREFEELPEVTYDSEGAEDINYVKEKLRSQMSETTFNVWINSINLMKKNGLIIAECPNNFTMQTVESRYADKLYKAIQLSKIEGRLVFTVEN